MRHYHRFAERLNRRGVGIDATHLAIVLMKNRLQNTFGDQLSPYDVEEDPADLAGSRELAVQDRFQFEWWALVLIDVPGEKKGSFETIVCQVKSGSVNVAMIRDLKGVMEREHSAIGVFVTLQKPTRNMIQEAISA